MINLRLPLSFRGEKKNTYYQKDDCMFTEDGIKIFKIYVPHAGRLTSNALHHYFKSFGEIANIEIINPTKTETGFKFSFIEYKKAEDAAKALMKKNHYIGRKKYIISAANSWHQPKQEIATSDDEDLMNTDSLILSLNDDCLLKLFGYLPIKEQLTLSKMSPRFQEILELYFKSHYKCFNIHQFDKLTLLNWRELLANCGQYIKSVVNSHDLSTNKTFDLIISSSPNLESLKLMSVTHLQPGTFQKMKKKTPKLRSMEILNCDLSDKLVNEITHLKELTELKISGCFHITGMHFQQFQNLRHLDINKCQNIIPRYFVEFLKVADKLESLNIVRCTRLTNEVFDEIPKFCKSLKTLKIGTTYSGWNLQKVADIEKLESLTIVHSDVYLREDIIKDLATKKADQLKEFHLVLSKFQQPNENDLQNILKFKNLEKLTLQGFKSMKNDYLVSLSNIFNHSLQSISLGYNTELTQKGILKMIEKCPHLTHIDLSHCILSTDFSEQLLTILEARRSKQNYEEQCKPFMLVLSMEQYRQSQLENLDKSVLLITLNYNLSQMQMMMDEDDSLDEDDFDADEDDDDFDFESDDDGLFHMMINAMFSDDEDESDFMFQHRLFGDDNPDEDFLNYYGL